MAVIDVVRIKIVKERNLKVNKRKITGPEDVKDIVCDYLDGADREHLVVLAVDTKNNINNISTVSIGSLNSSVVHPREVFKTLIESNAASFIIAHNHPSTETKPSNQDIAITQRLVECGKMMGIELLDHVIVGDKESSFTSFKKEGII
jgi:DNA repair protein RadC